MNSNREIWVKIDAVNEVSNFGEVRCYLSKCRKKIIAIPWMKKQRFYKGYLKVSIKGKLKFVHRLVLQGFIGESNLHVNHKNGIKKDNRLINLEYVTPLQNAKHAVLNGLRENCKGENQNTAKLKNKDVKFIRKSKLSNVDLAKKFNVHRITVGRIKLGQSWKHLY